MSKKTDITFDTDGAKYRFRLQFKCSPLRNSVIKTLETTTAKDFFRAFDLLKSFERIKNVQ